MNPDYFGQWGKREGLTSIREKGQNRGCDPSALRDSVKLFLCGLSLYLNKESERLSLFWGDKDD